jgi:hypothetical protein
MIKKSDIFDLKAYNELVRSVEYHRTRVKYLRDQIQGKIKTLDSKKNFLIRKGEKLSAKNYEREIKLLTLLKEVLYNFELGLTAVLERLDTIRIILQALDGFKPTAKAINEAINAAYYIPGNFQSLLESLAQSYINLIETVKPPEAKVYIDLANPEAEHILTQVEKEVGKIVVEQFPQIPRDIPILSSPNKRVEELISALATDGGISTGAPFYKQSVGKRNFEDQVYYYMTYISKGKLDVFGCARYLDTAPQRVIDALYILAEEGKIKFNS